MPHRVQSEICVTTLSTMPPAAAVIAHRHARAGSCGQTTSAPSATPAKIPAHRLHSGIGTPASARVRSGMRWHMERNAASSA